MGPCSRLWLEGRFNRKMVNFLRTWKEKNYAGSEALGGAGSGLMKEASGDKPRLCGQEGPHCFESQAASELMSLPSLEVCKQGLHGHSAWVQHRMGEGARGLEVFSCTKTVHTKQACS